MFKMEINLPCVVIAPNKKKVYKSYIGCQERILSCVVCMVPYSQTPLCGHPLNTHTSLLWTVCFVPWGKRVLTFSLNSTHLMRTLSMVPSLYVRINGVLLYFVLHIVPGRGLWRGYMEIPLYNMTPYIIPVFWNFAIS